MDIERIIKRIKVLDRRIEIRREKQFKMVTPVSEYDNHRYAAWEYEIDVAEEELEKLLEDNFNVSLFDWYLNNDAKENIYNGISKNENIQQ